MQRKVKINMQAYLFKHFIHKKSCICYKAKASSTFSGNFFPTVSGNLRASTPAKNATDPNKIIGRGWT